jgi:hypothetical protein
MSFTNFIAKRDDKKTTGGGQLFPEQNYPALMAISLNWSPPPPLMVQEHCKERAPPPAPAGVQLSPAPLWRN